MNAPSASPAEFFTHAHRDCDRLWANVEAAADGGEKAAVAEAWGAFQAATLVHFAMEEEVLFPAFEQATGMTAGPTVVMRGEHQQMRALMDQIAAAVAAGDSEDVVDHGDTLLMLIQQHNQKEETVLYPMVSQVLASAWPALHAQLESFTSG